MHLQPLQDLRQLVGRKKAAFPPRGKCGLLLTQGRPHHAPPGRTHFIDLEQREERLHIQYLHLLKLLQYSIVTFDSFRLTPPFCFQRILDVCAVPQL